MMLAVSHTCAITLKRMYTGSDVKSVRDGHLEICPKTVSMCSKSVISLRCPHFVQAHIVTATSGQLQAYRYMWYSNIDFSVGSTFFPCLPNVVSQGTPGNVSRCPRNCTLPDFLKICFGIKWKVTHL